MKTLIHKDTGEYLHPVPLYGMCTSETPMIFVETATMDMVKSHYKDIDFSYAELIDIEVVRKTTTEN